MLFFVSSDAAKSKLVTQPHMDTSPNSECSFGIPAYTYLYLPRPTYTYLNLPKPTYTYLANYTYLYLPTYTYLYT